MSVHTITGAIIGVGAARKVGGVRWMSPRTWSLPGS
jgi:phosphate/sulfate permease